MKKVAHFIDSPDPGGAETLVIEMCRILPDYGFEPEVMHFGNPWLVEKCSRYGIKAVLVPGRRLFGKIATIPLFSVVFSRFLKARGIDVLHSHLFGAVTGGSLAASLTGIPNVGTIHDRYTVDEKIFRIRLLQFSALLGTRLVTVSRMMREYFESLARFPDQSLRTIVNGVDSGLFAGPGNSGLRSELGVREDAVVLISVGRLVQLKRHDILIEAFSRLKLKRPACLLIVGDGPMKDSIQALVEEKGLSEKVLLLGQRDDVPRLLGISDCFVLASETEGLSCSIIEAMAAGLPVVATDVGGNRELVKDGESGYLVRPDDAIGLAAKLQDLADNDDRIKRFGRRSLLIAREDLTLEAMMVKYTALYDELCGKSAR